MPHWFSRKKTRKRKSYQACQGYGIPIEQCTRVDLNPQADPLYICPVCDDRVLAQSYHPKPSLFRLLKGFLLSLPPEKPYTSIMRHKDKREAQEAKAERKRVREAKRKIKANQEQLEADFSESMLP